MNNVSVKVKNGRHHFFVDGTELQDVTDVVVVQEAGCPSTISFKMKANFISTDPNGRVLKIGG